MHPELPGHDLTPPHTNLVPMCNTRVATMGTTIIFTNVRSGFMFVIRQFDLVNISNVTGDAALIKIDTTGGSGGNVFHSGYVGAGSYNRFPYTGFQCVPYQAAVSCQSQTSTGDWRMIASGYYVPATYTS